MNNTKLSLVSSFCRPPAARFRLRPWWLCVLVGVLGLVPASGHDVTLADEEVERGIPELTPRQKRVDRAIIGALKFLADEQMPSGAWRLRRNGESTAATSLAVMAFMGAGHVPGEGPLGNQLERAIRWVIDHQQENGMIVHQRTHGPMYSHGISTLMLAEVAGMVQGELARDVRRALERGIEVILKAQNVKKSTKHAGGWRYHPTSADSDLSVTGWQLLALRAARNIGCDVPAENIEQAVSYVNRCLGRSPGFGYQPGSASTPTLSGVGILALEVCGEHHSAAALRAADQLVQRPLRGRDRFYYYGVYYCTVGMFKVGGERWDDIRTTLIDDLLEQQQADHSWYARHGNEHDAGQNYCTAMAVLALTVEYRYLPIYQR